MNIKIKKFMLYEVKLFEEIEFDENLLHFLKTTRHIPITRYGSK